MGFNANSQLYKPIGIFKLILIYEVLEIILLDPDFAHSHD